MGLPLIAEVGEEKKLTEEFSLDDFKEVMTLLGYGSAVGSWTVAGIKKALQNSCRYWNCFGSSECFQHSCFHDFGCFESCRVQRS